MAVLESTGGNKQAAANLLGLYRPCLYSYIKRHNLDQRHNPVKETPSELAMGMRATRPHSHC